MRMKKILIIGTTYPRWKNDSVPSFLKYLADHMAIRGNIVSVIAPHFKGAKRNEQEGEVRVRRFRYMIPASAENIVYGGGGVFKIKKTPLYAAKLSCFVIAEFYAMLSSVVVQQIDVVNAHWIVPQGFVAIPVKWLTGRKVVVSVHGADILGLRGGFMTRVKRWILRHADYVVANSQATLTACKEVYPAVENKIRIIPMGIQLQHFKADGKPQYLIDTYDLKGAFTILFVGRLTTVKGGKYLLESVKVLQNKKLPIKVLIVGEGPEKSALEAYVKKHNLGAVVTFAGWKTNEELRDYYQVADVLVGPSLHEALGLVFAEAQASGLPVVASRVGGIPGIVKDGETGFLVPPRDSSAITKKVQQLYEDTALRAKMATTARKNIGDTLSWEGVSRQYDDLFDELIAKR